jgi:heme o synthase
VPLAAAPWPLGFAGPAYAAVSLTTGAIMVLLAMKVRRTSGEAGEQAAKRLFAFSILYLFLLFSVLLLEHGFAAPFGRGMALTR